MIRITFHIFVSLITAVLIGAAATAARAGTVQFQLGEQDFADGTTPILSSQIKAAGVGEAYPFDGTIFGDDLTAESLGAFAYTHECPIVGTKPVSAVLAVGLIDADSTAKHPLDTISISFDGIEQSTSALLAHQKTAKNHPSK